MKSLIDKIVVNIEPKIELSFRPTSLSGMAFSGLIGITSKGSSVTATGEQLGNDEDKGGAAGAAGAAIPIPMGLLAAPASSIQKGLGTKDARENKEQTVIVVFLRPELAEACLPPPDPKVEQ